MNNFIVIFGSIVMMVYSSYITGYAKTDKVHQNVKKEIKEEILAKKPKEIPSGIQLFGTNTLKKLENFRRECSKWPSDKVIQRAVAHIKQDERANIFGPESTVRWIKTVLQSSKPGDVVELAN